jgi:hypothetical protein
VLRFITTSIVTQPLRALPEPSPFPLRDPEPPPPKDILFGG